MTVTSERETFLAAISAAPDDTTLRLVFADWLDDHGEPARAALVRVQCRLAALPTWKPERADLEARERDLIATVSAPLAGLGFRELRWRRGFVDHVASGLRTFVESAPALPDFAPAYELTLGWDDRDGSQVVSPHPADLIRVYEAIAARPELRACVGLDVSAAVPYPEGLEPLLRSPHLTNLRKLNAAGSQAEHAVELVAAPTFANLRWLDVSGAQRDDGPSLVPLVTCPYLANLEHLDFGGNTADDDALEALATTPYMRRLRYLNLSGSWFTMPVRDFADADVPAPAFPFDRFVNADTLPALEELDLSDCFEATDGDSLTPFPSGWLGSGDEFLASLADSRLIRQLTRLHVRSNFITDRGAYRLAECGVDQRLAFVDVSDNYVGEDGQFLLAHRYGPDGFRCDPVRSLPQ